MFFDQLISISVFFPAAKPSGLRKVGVVMGGTSFVKVNFFLSYITVFPLIFLFGVGSSTI